LSGSGQKPHQATGSNISGKHNVVFLGENLTILFCHQVALTQLRELRLEENGLRNLSHFNNLLKLQSLYLGFNRVADIQVCDVCSGFD